MESTGTPWPDNMYVDSDMSLQNVNVDSNDEVSVGERLSSESAEVSGVAGPKKLTFIISFEP